MISIRERITYAACVAALACAVGCGTVGAVIGDVCTTANDDCAERSYCKAADGTCDDLLVIGFCAEKPEACTLEYAPVCGCDGQTYGNRCAASGAGVNVSAEGECDSEGSGDICGGIAGFACENENEYCRFENGTCGAADQTGICVTKPDACAEIFAPVCGCDDRTYGNACEAASAGVSVVSNGECPDDNGGGGGGPG